VEREGIEVEGYVESKGGGKVEWKTIGRKDNGEYFY